MNGAKKALPGRVGASTLDLFTRLASPVPVLDESDFRWLNL
jgi:hypothetical protein